jgi:hypothetical protein
MSDSPPTLAERLYPNQNKDAPAQPESEASRAARALYGNSPTARPGEGGASPLGGQAKPGSIFAPPDAARAPPGAEQVPTQPFNPELAKLPEGMTADPQLMSEYAGAAKELKLDQAGAQRLLDLHAKTKAAEAADWERTSAQWQAEVRAEIPQHQLQSAFDLVHNTELTDPELAKWLASSPAGNWKPLVRTLANYAEAIARSRRY